MDKFTPTGHLEVWKIYDDETEELHFEEQNVITSGMGIGLACSLGQVLLLLKIIKY